MGYGRNPVGVGRAADVPKVAEYGNLGLWGATPLGLDGLPTTFPKVAEYGNLGLWVTPRWGSTGGRCSQGSRVRQLWAMDHTPLGLDSIRLIPTRLWMAALS